jgi:hypothetical protein
MLLKTPHVRWMPILLASSLITGCAGDLGTPDYSSHAGLPPENGVRDPQAPFPPVPPDPYQPGDERLSVGYFYEGGWSVEVPINQVNTNYFIFAADENEVVGTLTYSQDISSDRVEGSESIAISLNGQPFWGGGLIWDDPIDLSEWTTMFVAFKSSDASFERFDLTLQWQQEQLPNQPAPEPVGVNLDPTVYGYVNDGEWHFLEIPLQDAIDQGFDPRFTRSPFIISAAGGRRGDSMLIDNLYFTKE